jgi:hypothetical protein
MKYSSRKDTLKHIRQVQKNIALVIRELRLRGKLHDRSKLQKEEKEGFDEYTPKLAGSTYGSEGYKQFLKELKPYLDHHYAHNPHHPEYYEQGIRGMNLVDIVEMFCDWYAATKRHTDGDIIKSIAINQMRFGYSDDLKAVFENTYRHVFQKGGADRMVNRVIAKILLLIWQFPQSIGAAILHFYLTRKGHKLNHYRYRGRTVYQWADYPRFAVSLGEYIFTHHFEEKTLAHEYGHSRQSRYLGPLYLLTVGVVSAMWNLLARRNSYISRTYYQRWPEDWADALGGVERKRL